MADGFVKIARLATSFEAHLLAGRLESAGIPSVPVDDFLEGSPAGTTLWVPEPLAARAREELARPDEPDEPGDVEEDLEPQASREPQIEPRGDADVGRVSRGVPALRCPQCGSTDVEALPRLLPILPAKRRCIRCRSDVRPTATRSP